MMGMGTMEILVILLVSFVFLGPQKMIEASRMLGKAVGQMRRIFQEIPQVDLEDLESVDKKNSYEGSPRIDEFNEGRGLAGEKTFQDQVNIVSPSNGDAPIPFSRSGPVSSGLGELSSANETVGDDHTDQLDAPTGESKAK